MMTLFYMFVSSIVIGSLTFFFNKDFLKKIF